MEVGRSTLHQPTDTIWTWRATCRVGDDKVEDQLSAWLYETMEQDEVFFTGVWVE